MSASAATQAPLNSKESSLRFVGKTVIYKFDGEAKEFSGQASIDETLSQPVQSARLDIKSARLTTFNKVRDKDMYSWLSVTAHPAIVFELTRVKLLEGDTKSASRTKPAKFKVKGKLSLNNHSQPIESTALGWREGNLLVVSGEAVVDTVAAGLPQIKKAFLAVASDVQVKYRLAFNLPPELSASN